MPVVCVTRKETFSAAHKVTIPTWTDEQNYQRFGKCANPNFHGHNYTLYVTVKGEVSEETGFVMDLKILSDTINDLVIELVDHKNLSLEVAFLENKTPSTENVAIGFWDILAPAVAVHGVCLYKITLYETPNNFVEYYGHTNPNLS